MGFEASSPHLRMATTPVTVDSMERYLWPHPAGVEAVNELLRLPVRGTEQDWEIELADGARTSGFLQAFESGVLDLEGRSALALLILFSITYSEVDIGHEDLERVRRAIRGDPTVLQRMQSYWGKGFADHEEKVKSLILQVC
ncbi:hypothetical protein [Brevundimonas sp.]|uniref:hypothetical protein n=1 Tax=Brevundimonas sp. TaxID=1871086 RepID=UPI002D2C7594|nr:hypothetical protein [Brevundimonas sp.]HYC96373.1 hypothetical protein [Brevundimonas sp.]